MLYLFALPHEHWEYLSFSNADSLWLQWECWCWRRRWWKSNLATGEFVLCFICHKMWFSAEEASFNLQSTEVAISVFPPGGQYITNTLYVIRTWPLAPTFYFHSAPATVSQRSPRMVLVQYQYKWEQLTQLIMQLMLTTWPRKLNLMTERTHVFAFPF